MSSEVEKGAICQHCGYQLDHRVREIEWELLERCPECGAYDWKPEPVWERAEVKS